jgi:hypothetical protein
MSRVSDENYVKIGRNAAFELKRGYFKNTAERSWDYNAYGKVRLTLYESSLSERDTQNILRPINKGKEMKMQISRDLMPLMCFPLGEGFLEQHNYLTTFSEVRIGVKC